MARIPNWLSFIFNISAEHVHSMENLACKGISYSESRWTSSSKGHVESSIGPEMGKVLNVMHELALCPYAFIPATLMEWRHKITFVARFVTRFRRLS